MTRVPSQSGETLSGRADVRVVICTWNRSTLLAQTLDSLTRLVVPPDLAWDVVVVNNNCTDDTDRVVAQFSEKLPLRVVYEPVAGLSNARNRALTDCLASYILFTDDDVLVSERWLAAFVDATRRYPEAAAFAGPVEPWFPVRPDPELLEAFPIVARGFCGIDHQLPLGILPPPLKLVGANMGFRMNAVHALQFDPALGVNQDTLGGGEEDVFVASVRRNGDDVIWVPDMSLRHYVDPSRLELSYLRRLNRDRGRSRVRERGFVGGRMIAGAPAWLWVRLGVSLLGAVAASVTQSRIKAAVSWARVDRYRAKVAETRALSRPRGATPRAD